MMMFVSNKKRRSFRSRMRKLKNWVAFSIFILMLGYLVNTGLHTAPGLTLAFACVGTTLLFILVGKGDL